MTSSTALALIPSLEDLLRSLLPPHPTPVLGENPSPRLGADGVTMSFPFLKAPSGAAGVVGKFLLLSVVVLADASCAASSQVWRLLRKLWSGSGRCSMSVDPSVAHLFISVRVL